MRTLHASLRVSDLARSDVYQAVGYTVAGAVEGRRLVP
jgi:hypothetical protein